MSDTSVPVVLVHGYLSSAAVLWPIRRALSKRGFQAHTVSLEPLAIGDVRRMARQLDRSVERIRSRTGADKVDLVGISLGGLIGLWWLKHLGGAARARRFVAVGCPFQGTWFALVAVAALGLVSRGAWQTLPNSQLLRQVQGTPPVPTTSICIEGDQVAPPARCWLPGAEHLVLKGPPISAVAHQWLVLHRHTMDAIARTLEAEEPG